MDISGDYVFEAPQKLVWDALQDPNVLGSVMPGGKGFEKTAENQYGGVLEVKVGPVQGTFQGQLTLSNVVPPECYQITVDGKGAPGFVKATGKMRLEARGEQTFMEYSGQAQVGGRIASVGQRLVESAARSIIRQSLEALNAYLKAEVAAQQAAAAPPPTPVTTNTSPTNTAPVASVPAPAPAVVDYKPPTQTALAFTLARDVLNDIIPAKYQGWVVAAIVVLIVAIILLIASR